jgi:protocatechuate 3,4-dioxygenase, alpha subunit
MSSLKQTPSQTVGPFFAYGLCPTQYSYDLPSLFTPAIADVHAAGEHILIVGQVWDGAGKPISDALIEMMQANADGRYVTTPEEIQASGFRGFARVGTGTDPQHRFIVETIKPGSTAADCAPHIDIIVMMRGVLVHAFTRLYFDDEAAANARDTVLNQVPEPRRTTLIARRDPGAARAIYRFDIRMQGPDETVFFDL